MREKWNATQSNKFSKTTDNLYTLPHTACENRQWERCPIRFRIRHRKLTHEQHVSTEQPLTCECCGEDTRLTIKQLLNEDDTPYGGTLYKFVISNGLQTVL